ncbi:MAG: alpha/beta hydrolase fold domain-containing protein [Shimia sp.]
MTMPPLNWVTDPPERLRAAYAETRAALLPTAPSDVVVEAVPQGLRFTPPNVSGAPILYFHGGGWMVGAPETHRVLCAALAQISGRVVTSVRYRLAPEHPYPAQREDAVAGLRAHGGPCFVAGDSAGAAMALWAQSGAAEVPVLGVVGFYGAFGCLPTVDDPGQLTRAEVTRFYGALGVDPATIRDDMGAEGPDLLLLAAGDDSLLQDSHVLANEMRRDVTLWEAEGQPHAFLHAAAQPGAAREWMIRCAEWMAARDLASKP